MTAPRTLTGSEQLCNECATVFDAEELGLLFGDLADHELSMCAVCIAEVRADAEISALADAGDVCDDCGCYRAYVGRGYRCMGCGSSR